MRSPALGIVAGVAFLAACGPGGAVSYEITAAVRMAGTARLRIGDRLLAEFADGERFTLREGLPILTRRAQGEVRAEVLTPDGWLPAGSTILSSRSRAWEDEELRAGRPLRLDLEVLPPAGAFENRFMLVLDNRNGEAVRVSLGAMTLDVAAGEVMRRELPCPQGPPGEVVRIGTREIGRVTPGDERKRRRLETGGENTGLAWWLVDIQGGRRYSTRQVVYVRPGATPPDRVPAKVVLPPAPIHALGFQGAVSLFRPASGVKHSETPWSYGLEVLEEP